MSSRVIVRDRGWLKIKAAVEEAQPGVSVRVGVLESAGRHRHASIDVTDLAMIHEFGSGRIPARPFLRPAIEAGEREIFALQRQFSAQILAGTKVSHHAIGDAMGALGKRLILARMHTGPFVPLSPQTIKRKGHARPLFDSNQLYDSVSWEVDPAPTAFASPPQARPEGFASPARALPAFFAAPPRSA